jgi:hypothetical protein
MVFTDHIDFPFLVSLCLANATILMPFSGHDKCPILISLITRHGGDRFLLDITQAVYATI